ncbi:hypothetical protein BDA99DRAFT_574138 [Phascolomyces articulosus]|uniref:Uncharacterized protein n=1 Tax=Phascolomyces articulosus TaxID=60185 RepID=A0AAD5K473_9FUNG|nr:hypothetical protein BDA99DRAFT_574138 [Phascolomyces articulosus]
MLSPTNKSNILSSNNGITRQQLDQQPESSTSSSTHYQRTRSDDLAPILSQQQKRHSATTTRTEISTYYPCEEDMSSSHSKNKQVLYSHNQKQYQRASLGVGMMMNDGKNKAITSWLDHCPWNNESNNNSNTNTNDLIYHEQQHPERVNIENDYPNPFLGILVVILFIESVVIIVLEGFRVRQNVYQSSQCLLSITGVGVSFTNLIYRALVIAISLYQLLLCVDTLRQRSAAQLYALILLGFLYVIFAIIQTYQNQSIEEWMVELQCIDETSRTIGPHYEYAILAVIPACFLVFIGCSIWLHRQFTWYDHCYYPQQQKSRTLMTTPENNSNQKDEMNPRFKKAAVTLATLLALVKVDLFFFFSFAVQLSPSALLYYDTTTMEALLVAGLGMVLFIIGYYGILNEKPWVLGFVTLVAAVSIAYFVFRLITFAQPHLSSPSGEDPYRATRYSLIYTLLVLIILTTLTTGVAVATIRSMMHGVRILRDCASSTQRINNNTSMTTAYYSHDRQNKSSSSSFYQKHKDIGRSETK